MANKNLVADLLAESPNRRGLLKKLGIASAAVAAGGMMKVAADPASPTVVDGLQFALNLEYLEAEFYTVATMGKTIDQVGIEIGGDGTPGPTTGGNAVNFSNNLFFTQNVAMEIGEDERAHVTLLRTALPKQAIRP
jgi:hypothetical protein